MSVLCTEVDVGHRSLRVNVQSVADAFSAKLDLDIHAVVDDNVKGVLKFLNFISHTANCDSFLILGCNDTIALNHLPPRVLVLGKGCVLGINLAHVCDLKALSFVLKDCDLAKIELLFVQFDIWAARRGQNKHHDLTAMAIDFDYKICPHWS